MNNKIKILLIVCLSLLIAFSVACRENEGKSNDNSYTKFIELEIGTSYEIIMENFGQPAIDVGSGVPLLIYESTDPDSPDKPLMLELKFSADMKLISISQINESGDVIKVIKS